MIVILSSNCKLKAKIKTRRIVSKYLEQIGSKVWMGYISNENLKSMHDELIDKRSVYSSIICHKVVSRKRTDILFKVGNMMHFDSNGNYAYSITQSKRMIEPNHSKMVEVMGLITGLSGFFHDLGKATVGFQNKLENAINNPHEIHSDAIRHECVSYLMLTLFESDQHLVETLIDRDALKDLFENKLPQHLEMLRSDLTPKIKAAILEMEATGHYNNVILSSIEIKSPLSAKNFKKNPLLTALLWLVLNHHKAASAIDIKLERNSFSIKLDDYINLRHQTNANPDDFITISPKTPPWASSEWLDAVQAYGTRLDRCLSENELDTGEFNKAFPLNTPWINLLTLAARPALVFADYYISMESTIDEIVSEFSYANTRSNHDGTIQWADTLPCHLLGVGFQSSQLFRDLHAHYEHPTKSLPCMMQNDIPEALIKSDHKQVPDRFKWQNIVINNIKKHLKQHPEVRLQPMFAVLVSRTGSGKTRTAPAVMCLLSEKIRFSLGLGRRTLTLQSYKAYQEKQIGFSQGDLALLIGQTLPHDNPENQCQVQGSEGVEFEDQHFLIRQSDPSIPEKVMEGKLKEMALLNAPVSIMTVDHLIKTTYAGKSTDLKLLHHIQHSDLILDEIDDYSDQDITVLAKLIYLYGFFGRKVLLASATMPAAQIESLHHAFMEGIRMREGVYETTHNVTHVMINDVEPYIKTTSLTSNESHAFMDEYTAFIGMVCAQLDTLSRKHTIKTYAMPEHYDDRHTHLLEMCSDMHHMNHILDQDIKVSMGFVRFNNVIEAQMFAQFLNQHNMDSGDSVIKVACYHSQMLTLDRHYVEKNLDSLLNRKTNVFGYVDPLLQHSVIQDALNQAKEKCKSNVQIIVSTTSIQETGRDHDYDWCLLEPLSSRSLVQSAGRVWRHRQKTLDPNCANVGLMEHPIKAIPHKNLTPENCVVYGFPGLESIGFKGRSNINSLNELMEHAPHLLLTKPTESMKQWIEKGGIKCPDSDIENHRIFNARDVLDRYFFENGIDASPCLMAPKCYQEHPIEAMFIGVITRQFKDPRILDFRKLNQKESDQIFRTLNSFTQRSDVKLTNIHGKTNRFRDGSGIQITLFAKPSGSHPDYKSVWTYFKGRHLGGKITLDPPKHQMVKNALFDYSHETSEARISKMQNDFNYTKKELDVMLSMSLSLFGDINKHRYNYSHFYGLLKSVAV